MFLQILRWLLSGFLGFIGLATIIYLKYTVLNQGKIREQLAELTDESLPLLDKFTIHNPHSAGGNIHKAQLHAHSTESDGELTPSQLVQRYQQLGYTFLAITDHDKLTQSVSQDTELVLVPGEEMTQPRPFWPLGYHISRLFVQERVLKGSLQQRIDQTQAQGGMVVINHPTFIGNLGTQQWLPQELASLQNFCLLEIANYHTTTADNIRVWHGLMKKLGPERPIWAVAGDDTHKEQDIDANFIHVQVEEVSQNALAKALRAGNFYPTQGPSLWLDVAGRLISVETDCRSKIRFIDADLQVRQEVTGTTGEYQALGDEGLIRVEIQNLETGRIAWSQPLWLLEEVLEKEESIPSAS